AAPVARRPSGSLLTWSCLRSPCQRDKARAGDEAKIGARIGCSDSRSRQIWIERQIEPRRPVLQSGEQQHLHGIEADGAKPQPFAHGPFHLVLVEILHQPQYLVPVLPRSSASPLAS